MARDESDREDLLREATALIERIELLIVPSVGNTAESRVVAGFRASGAFSVFFDDDPVYQFNAAGELRRAYCGGFLIKASHRRLVSLERVRRREAVELVRHDLSDDEQAAVVRQMADRMLALQAQLASGRYEIVGQVPHNDDVIGRVKGWLADRVEWPIADTPRV